MKKNRSISKYMLALLVATGLTACSNNMDEVVYSDVMEQSYNYQTKDFATNINGAYDPLRSTTQMMFWQTQELTSCAIVTAPNISGWNDGGVYLQQHFHNWNSELGVINDIWNGYYRGVVLCNSAIAKVQDDRFPGISDAQKAEGLAELRALRAYYYWLICDNFGDAPLVTTMEQGLPQKATRKELYDFLVSELTEAIPDLSENQDASTYGRFNKWAGKCLLANVYVNAEVYTGTPQWEACIQQCDDIINSGKCALSPNYKDPFRTTGVEDSKEVLMTIPYDYDRAIWGNWLWMNSWHKELKKRYLTAGTPNEAGGMKAIGQFIDSYDPDDGRIDDTWLHGLQYDADGNLLYGQYDMPGEPLNFTKDLPSANYTNEMEGYRMNKYEVERDAQWSSNTDIPVFRYAEVLLMKGECLLRLNRPGAGQLVTQVRQRNFKSHPEKAVVTDEQLRGDSNYPWGYVENYKIVDKGDQTPVRFGRMFDEYMWEYAYESHARRDMIRFGVYTTKSWLSHKPNGNHRTVFPIPESALTANPNLTQNPDYQK
ncbi:MAG: RagB/SusD family nutrient uptake outer membrane protein [Prevotella sp.]|nr:RagB/SusD family nutrient uptake outer membrane protein [Prevotella sp.]